MNFSLVSVVIPTHDREDVIMRAIDSVLNQTYKNIELIVVDDGSTDSTEKIVLSCDDPRLKYVSFENNRGGSAAMNFGVHLARGKWIALLDSDDVFLPEKISAQVNFLESKAGEKYSSIGCRAENRDSSGKVIGYWPPKNRIFGRSVLFTDTLKGTAIPLSSWMFRKEEFRLVGGFDEEIFKSKDRDFLIRFTQVSCFKFLDECFVIREMSEKSITNSRKPLSLLKTLEKNAASYSQLDGESLSKLYMTVAIELFKTDQSAQAVDACRCAHSLHPSFWPWIYASSILSYGNYGAIKIAPFLLFRKMKSRLRIK